MILRRLQRGLEKIYRLDAAPDVRRFLLDERSREHLAPARQPREQLFVAGNDDSGVSVFLATSPIHTPQVGPAMVIASFVPSGENVALS